MGYKSIINSAVSAQKKANRERQLEINRENRKIEQLNKKFQKVNDKLDKIYSYLTDEYAKGKIDKTKYDTLCERKKDITIDKIIVGKTPYINLAKRYLTGKIDRTVYEEILKTVLPSDFLQEKEEMIKDLDNSIDTFIEFHQDINHNHTNKCQKCAMEKSFFKRLSNIDDIILCSNCKIEYTNVKRYKGFDGNYFYINPMEFTKEHLSKDYVPAVNINSDLL